MPIPRPFPAGLEPAHLWKCFDLVRSHPRGSGNEAAVRAAIIGWADERGLAHEVDATGNLLVRVPATPGKEGCGATVLQGHLDMVCEKNADVDFDFATQGIEVELDGDLLRAVGTTLGADNGIGVAAAMAVVDDPAAPHGPLELLMTVDEERGLTGAFGLQPGFLTGRRMLNLDTEEEGAVYVGCAGGGDVSCLLPRDDQPRPAGATPHRIEIKGLVGGHSGLDALDNRANAIKCLARVLSAIDEAALGYQLSRVEGGSMRNAIPREAHAGGCVPERHAEELSRIVARVGAELAAEFAPTDPGLCVTVEPRPDCRCASVFTPAATTAVIRALTASPSSVVSMSRSVPGLVETSTNLGVVRTTDAGVEVIHCTRSSLGSALEAVRQSIAAIFRLAGGQVEMEASYPGWQPDLDSPLLATALRVHEELFGRPAEVKAVHAGLECGLIGKAYPGLDMISLGPTLLGAHSPAERLSVASTARFYRHVVGILADLE